METFQNILGIKMGELTVGKLCGAVLIFVIGYCLTKLLLRLVRNMLAKTALDQTVQNLVLTVARVLCYIVLALTVAGSLNIPVTSLVAAFSVVGLAVSLAVQEALANLTGGIMLMVNKPFALGDYIEFGSTGGTVDQIGLVYTKLLTPDNKSVSIPNSQISNAQVINYTSQVDRRLDMLFAVSYDAPIDLVKKVLWEVIGTHNEVRTEPAPFVGVMEFQDSSIQYVVRLWVPKEEYWNCRFAMMEEVKAAFDANGIEMTYNHLNVHIIEK